MKIFLATSNLGKVKEFREKLINSDITIDHVEIPYPEIQSDSLEEIAKFGAKFLVNKINEIVTVEDSGLFINNLKGFPGPYSKHTFYTIGCEGIIKLLEGIEDRNAYFESVIGYCQPGKVPITFKGRCVGRIAKKQKGTGGFGYDPIFIPNGSKITFGQMDTVEKNKHSHRGKSVEMFMKFLK